MSYLASLPHPTDPRFQSAKVSDKSLLTWINPNWSPGTVPEMGNQFVPCAYRKQGLELVHEHEHK